MLKTYIEHVKKLKILAKHCSLQPLSTMLGKRRPKWGTLFPIYDLTPSLAPTGHHFSYGLLLDLCLRTFFIAWTSVSYPFTFLLNYVGFTNVSWNDT